MRDTDKVTKPLAKYLRRCHPRQARKLVEGLDYYGDIIDAHAKRPNPEPAGSVAWGLLDCMDTDIRNRLARDKEAHRIACKPGCAACCRIEVGITPGEAELLVHGARELGVSPDPLRLVAQAAVQEWNDIPPESRACVFLGADNQCTVYQYRPGACRKYFALDNPDKCDTIKDNGAEVINLIVPEAEVIASAMLSRQGHGRMANQILGVLSHVRE